jgi:predicted nucleotidyltransferase
MEKIINLLNKNFKPASIFLYGSRARTDFLEESDFEIGVVFLKDNYIGRSEIKKTINKKEFSIYPFEYKSFIAGKIDTPFQKKIHLYELVATGKTLSGEKIIEGMKLPQISVFDLTQDLRFNLGYALASVISHRNRDRKTASLEFSKSCLFATRCLEILKLEIVPLTYDEIFNLSKKIKLEEYEELFEKAYNVRNRKNKYKEEDLFQNISYLNKLIEPILLEFFEKEGNKILINKK